MRQHPDRRSRPMLFIALGVLVAGCLAPPGESDAGDAAPPGLPPVHYLLDEFPLDLDHDHSDPAAHAGSFNLEFVDYHSCTPDDAVASAPGGFADITFHGTYAFVGHARGFCILDIQDPTHVTFVGAYEGEAASDLEISHDGRTVFLATQRTVKPGPLQRNSTDLTDDAPRGIILVDVSQPSDPRFESYYPMPLNGVHTATPYLLDGRQLLFLQTYDWLPPASGENVTYPRPQENAPATQRVEVTELVDAAGTRALRLLSRWSLDRPVDQPFLKFFPHDSGVQFHPVLQKHVLHVAYWDAGLLLLDVTDPGAPQLLSRYNDADSSPYVAYHDARVFPELVAGRQITVISPEVEVGAATPVVRFIDTTDPMNPAELSTWRLPGDPGIPGGFLFSPHVLSLQEGRVYLGHYHGGVWVIDVHNETLLHAPATAGYFFPRGDESTQTFGSVLETWGAYYHDGYVYASAATGVHVLRYVGDSA